MQAVRFFSSSKRLTTKSVSTKSPKISSESILRLNSQSPNDALNSVLLACLHAEGKHKQVVSRFRALQREGFKLTDPLPTNAVLRSCIARKENDLLRTTLDDIFARNPNYRPSPQICLRLLALNLRGAGSFDITSLWNSLGKQQKSVKLTSSSEIRSEKKQPTTAESPTAPSPFRPSATPQKPQRVASEEKKPSTKLSPSAPTKVSTTQGAAAVAAGPPPPPSAHTSSPSKMEDGFLTSLRRASTSLIRNLILNDQPKDAIEFMKRSEKSGLVDYSSSPAMGLFLAACGQMEHWSDFQSAYRRQLLSDSMTLMEAHHGMYLHALKRMEQPVQPDELERILQCVTDENRFANVEALGRFCARLLTRCFDPKHISQVFTAYKKKLKMFGPRLALAPSDAFIVSVSYQCINSLSTEQALGVLTDFKATFGVSYDQAFFSAISSLLLSPGATESDRAEFCRRAMDRKPLQELISQPNTQICVVDTSCLPSLERFELAKRRQAGQQHPKTVFLIPMPAIRECVGLARTESSWDVRAVSRLLSAPPPPNTEIALMTFWDELKLIGTLMDGSFRKFNQILDEQGSQDEKNLSTEDRRVLKICLEIKKTLNPNVLLKTNDTSLRFSARASRVDAESQE